LFFICFQNLTFFKFFSWSVIGVAIDVMNYRFVVFYLKNFPKNGFAPDDIRLVMSGPSTSMTKRLAGVASNSLVFVLFGEGGLRSRENMKETKERGAIGEINEREAEETRMRRRATTTMVGSSCPVKRRSRSGSRSSRTALVLLLWLRFWCITSTTLSQQQVPERSGQRELVHAGQQQQQQGLETLDSLTSTTLHQQQRHHVSSPTTTTTTTATTAATTKPGMMTSSSSTTTTSMMLMKTMTLLSGSSTSSTSSSSSNSSGHHKGRSKKKESQSKMSSSSGKTKKKKSLSESKRQKDKKKHYSYSSLFQWPTVNRKGKVKGYGMKLLLHVSKGKGLYYEYNGKGKGIGKGKGRMMRYMKKMKRMTTSSSTPSLQPSLSPPPTLFLPFVDFVVTADSTNPSNTAEHFVARIIDPGVIAQARAELKKSDEGFKIISGTIEKTPVDWNPGWSYHFIPGTIFFGDFFVEVCDSSATFFGRKLGQSRWCILARLAVVSLAFACPFRVAGIVQCCSISTALGIYHAHSHGYGAGPTNATATATATADTWYFYLERHFSADSWSGDWR
jgi:hypothetical protein